MVLSYEKSTGTNLPYQGAAEKQAIVKPTIIYSNAVFTKL
jgi:hypothetical protein